MTDPKPVRMWAVWHPFVGLLHETVRQMPYACEAAMEKLEEERMGGSARTWPELTTYGYRCIRVTIIPDPESEK